MPSTSGTSFCVLSMYAQYRAAALQCIKRIFEDSFFIISVATFTEILLPSLPYQANSFYSPVLHAFECFRYLVQKYLRILMLLSALLSQSFPSHNSYPIDEIVKSIISTILLCSSIGGNGIKNFLRFSAAKLG